MIRYYFIFVLFLRVILLESQPIVGFNYLAPSQNTNNFIYVTSRGGVCISSIDGFNFYNGLQNKLYHPASHKMFGANVQSNFFEESSGKIWFTTYEALHCFDPQKDQIEYNFIITKAGDTLQYNYRLFHFEEPLLYLKAGDNLYSYDIFTKKVVSEYPINLASFFNLSIIKTNNQIFLFAGSDVGYQVFLLKDSGEFNKIKEGDISIQGLLADGAGNWWVANSSGNLSLFSLSQKTFTRNHFISSASISGLGNWSANKILISTSAGELVVFNIETGALTDSLFPVNAVTHEPIKQPIIPYMDKDSTLWIGGNGQGVFFCNLKKKKINHYLGAGVGETLNSISKLISLDDHTFIAFARRHGIIKFDSKGRVLEEWNQLPNGKIQFTPLRGCKINEYQILFTDNNQFYILDLNANRIKHYPLIPKRPFSIEQIEILPNGKIIASCDTSLMQELIIKSDHISAIPYGNLQGKSKNTTFFKSDLGNNLYVSNDEKTILVLSPTKSGGHQFDYELPINGGVWGLYNDAENDIIYISNSLGLFQLNSQTKEYKRLVDKKNLLAQTIYSVQQDNYGNLWMGTNKGLVKYYPENNETKAFSIMDGVQGMEYNSHAYLTTSDGHMLFGGINGVNYFKPEDIKLSEKAAPVLITKFLINDEFDSLYRVPSFLQLIELPYAKNTISFDFHAVDYSDPVATKVKYKMAGIDNDYVESRDAAGFARYANMRPGNYTLSIIGQNADGVWNNSPKEIGITIKPPYWLTWWFLTLSVLTVGGILYYSVRSYYQRKLAKKNQLLREQSLIIEKQQAVENERTRIASEMHDDLGSGLTTIRYLSDKALKQAKDSDEATQIKRIADHSNTLVRNMSEIIWAMNSRFDNTENLIGYLRRYASEYLDERQMPFTFDANGSTEIVSIGGEKRRNIFLIFKELLHNSIKYSKAKSIAIFIETTDNFSFRISEISGIGFDPDLSIEKGNGLFNIQKRLKSIEGHMDFDKTDDAMHIIVTVPINVNNLA